MGHWFRRAMYSETTAYVAGGAVVLCAAALAFSIVGWLGFGMVGLIGLLISTRLALHDGHAVQDSDYGTGAVPNLARQVAEINGRGSKEERWADQAKKTHRSRALYILNSVFIAMIIMGFGLFLVPFL